MRATASVLAVLIVALTLTACGKPPANESPRPPGEAAAAAAPEAGPPAEVSPAEALALAAGSEGALFLDVRSADEYASGHVPGALLVPHGEVGARLSELEPWRDRPVLVYCESGRRAALAAEELHAAGFSRVSLVAGSMQRWRSEGLEVETAAQ